LQYFQQYGTQVTRIHYKPPQGVGIPGSMNIDEAKTFETIWEQLMIGDEESGKILIHSCLFDVVYSCLFAFIHVCFFDFIFKVQIDSLDFCFCMKC